MFISPPHWQAGLSVQPGSNNRSNMLLVSFSLPHFTSQPRAQLFRFKTQYAAIEWAKKNGYRTHVARVRQLNDKKKPDYWRSV
jgi:hypothetical protein